MSTTNVSTKNILLLLLLLLLLLFYYYYSTIRQKTLLERFSVECRKTKNKVISLANHNGRRQSNEPIRTRNKYRTTRAGKRVRASHNWFWFSDWLRKWSEKF